MYQKGNYAIKEADDFLGHILEVMEETLVDGGQ
jgi:hypothetical protein